MRPWFVQYYDWRHGSMFWRNIVFFLLLWGTISLDVWILPRQKLFVIVTVNWLIVFKKSDKKHSLRFPKYRSRDLSSRLLWFLERMRDKRLPYNKQIFNKSTNYDFGFMNHILSHINGKSSILNSGIGSKTFWMDVALWLRTHESNRGKHFSN